MGVLAVGATGFVLLALHNGQDANWDLQNYHIYDAVALLHWRYPRDVVPAGPQTTLNPIPYLPPYLLNRFLPPRVAAGLLAAVQSIAAFVAWCIGIRVARSGWIAIIATIAAATASMVLAEIGTSLEELLLSIPVLAGIWLLVAPDAWSGRRSRSTLLLAGLLTGVAVGFKITLLPVAMAMLGATAMTTLRVGRLPAFLHAGAGVAAGFLLSGGVWAGALWWRFGNPFFPFLNNIFRSASADPIAFGDSNAVFRGIGPALARPFQAAITGIPAPLDVPFRDARPLTGLVLALIWLIVRRRDPLNPIAFLSIYLLCGEAVWIILCPVERYALVLDLLAGMLAILAAAELVPRRAVIGASVLLAAVLMGSTQATDFFHRPWSQPYTAHPPPALGADYDLVLLGPPLGYWVGATPSPRAAFGLFGGMLRPGGVLQQRLDSGISAAGERLWAVGIDLGGVDLSVRQVMERHGLVLAPPCLRADSMYWVAAVFCRAAVVPPRLLGASDLPIGTAVAFTTAGDGWIYEQGGWGATESDGTWANGGVSTLIFRNTEMAPLIMEVRLEGFPDGPAHTVRVTAAGRTSLPFLLARASEPLRLVACVGRERGFGDVATVQFSTDPGSHAFRLENLLVRRTEAGECAGPTQDAQHLP